MHTCNHINLIYVCMYVSMYLCIYVCIYLSIYLHILILIYIYIYLYNHAYVANFFFLYIRSLDKTLHRESYSGNSNNNNNNNDNNNGQDNSIEISLLGKKISILEEIIASDGFIRPATIQPRGLNSQCTLNRNALNELELDTNNHDKSQQLLLQNHQQQQHQNPEMRFQHILSDESYVGSHDDGDYERGANDCGIVGEKKVDGNVK